MSNLVVSSFYRREGVVTCLLNLIINFARKLVRSVFLLSVNKKDTLTLKLHGKYGSGEKKERINSCVLKK